MEENRENAVSTVPEGKLSHGISTWNVRKSGFPFSTPGPVIATVEADDYDTALQLAEYVCGYPVVVEHQRNAADSPAFSPASHEGRR